MKQEQKTNIDNNPSKLEQFNIGFEYDKTLSQLKNETRARTHKQ